MMRDDLLFLGSVISLKPESHYAAAFEGEPVALSDGRLVDSARLPQGSTRGHPVTFSAESLMQSLSALDRSSGDLEPYTTEASAAQLPAQVYHQVVIADPQTSTQSVLQGELWQFWPAGLYLLLKCPGCHFLHASFSAPSQSYRIHTVSNWTHTRATLHGSILNEPFIKPLHLPHVGDDILTMLGSLSPWMLQDSRESQYFWPTAS